MAFKMVAVEHSLVSISMLHVFVPKADKLSSVEMHVGAIAMSFIIHPVSFVDIAIAMNQSTPPTRLVINPKAFVFASIYPYLNAFSFSKKSFDVPLSMVHRSILELNRPFFDQLAWILNNLMVKVIRVFVIKWTCLFFC